MRLKFCFSHILVVAFIALLSACDANKSDTKVQACFTPGENCTQSVVNLIRQAKTSILIQASAFSSDAITDAILAAKGRNVNIKILFDKALWIAQNPTVATLLEEEIPIFLDKKVLLAHNNVMIIDHRQVITGSFNFTRDAQEKNADNLLIIENKSVAKRYEDNWRSRAVVAEEVTELPVAEKTRQVCGGQKCARTGNPNRKPKNSGGWHLF
jgi:phosphatidylserine/phosphatidylglycerophosphate/cardiolipin synthase-like enzyme